MKWKVFSENEIKRLLLVHGISPTPEIIERLTHFCNAYQNRLHAQKHDVVKELNNLLKKIQACGKSKISYEARLAVGFTLSRFEEVLPEIEDIIRKTIDSLTGEKGSRETWTRDLFMFELLDIYEEATGKKATPPYKNVKKYGGPFFRFVEDFLNYAEELTGSKTTSSQATTKSAIEKLLGLQDQRYIVKELRALLNATPEDDVKNQITILEKRVRERIPATINSDRLNYIRKKGLTGTNLLNVLTDLYHLK